MKTSSLLCTSLLSLALASGAQAVVTLDWVTVGNAGNANDSTGFGAVGYTYQIMKYEVTNAQYAEFLNAVAATDTNQLYNTNMDSNARGGITRTGSSGNYSYAVKANFGDKPVNYVSHLDAQRFANWLHNNQGNGSTETGVYDLTQAPGDSGLALHIGSSNVWIPTENEWYKAAYYDPTLNSGAGGYWLYPTQSNTAPTIAASTTTGDISNPGTNVANYDDGASWNTMLGNVTAVGSAGALSASYYGTFDQGGNVTEWNEAVVGVTRGVRGGSWVHDTFVLASSFNFSLTPSFENETAGFRLAGTASVPEPSRAMLLLGGLGAMVLRRRRRASTL